MKILVTGATGKVGRRFIARLLDEPQKSAARVQALCHNRALEPHDRLTIVRGSISDQGVVERAMDGVTHVVHLATCKETPQAVMDVTVKGMFWLLEAFRQSPTAQRFILVGGDAAIGHFHYRHSGPLTEDTPFRAYPGCYALSKALEEVMLQQYYVQYDLDGCCLRAPWIMEKDDFRHSLSFGPDQFGGPPWRDLAPAEEVARLHAAGAAPCLLDADGRPLKRNFVHVEDLVAALLVALDHPRARQELFHICMDEPVDYGKVASYLRRTRGLPSVDIPSPFHSNWMDNSKARFFLDWRPEYDLEKLIESSWNFVREADDPRVVYYPG